MPYAIAPAADPGPITRWPLPVKRLAGVQQELGGRRTGRSTLEVAALARLEEMLPSLRVPMLARFGIWPADGKDFADHAGLRTPAQYYNMLGKAQGRTQAPVRRKFERWAGLPPGAVDIVDIPRRRIGRTPRAGERDGTSPMEQWTITRVRDNIAALPPRMVVELLIWPYELSDLADELDRAVVQVHNTLQGGLYRYPALREQIARFMEIEDEWLDHLIDAERTRAVSLDAPLQLPL